MKLFPYKEYILFCDFDAKRGEIEPIYEPGDDSLNLEEVGISQPFNCERWAHFPGQNGGLAKVDSGFYYAANFSSFACVA